MPERLYSYTGIIHVHSTHSDGTRPVDEIAHIADELDIDFLLITDHNTLAGKSAGEEGWYGDVLVGIGTELNDKEDKNHYLAFNIDEELDPELPPEAYMEKVKELGGFGIIAHPNESRGHIPEYPAFPWTRWQSDEYDGIEIWNHMSEWMEGLTRRNKYRRAMHPRRSVIRPKNKTIRYWDEVNLRRKVVGVGGVDAHAHIYKFMGIIPIRVFRYKVSFRTIRTHILLKEPLRKGNDWQHDLNSIYNSITNANCYISHNSFGDARAFRFYLQNSHGKASVGEFLPEGNDAQAIVRNPIEAETVLYHNGQLDQSKFGSQVIFTITQPGHYRVETRIKGRPWIISNHIRYNI